MFIDGNEKQNINSEIVFEKKLNMGEFNMKNLFKIFLLTLLAVCALCIAGCENTPSKEEIAYKMICYVAEDYNEDPSNITLQSGSIEEEESGDYFAAFTVSVGSQTMYFCGTYYIETGKIGYTDMTNKILSLGFAGPGYYDTESFDIAKVNKMLQK